jgi:hypothetical protein
MKGSKKVIITLTLTAFLFLLISGSASAGSVAASLTNPIGVDDPRDIIGNVIKAMLGIAGSLALLFFIYGGLMWVMAGGSDEKIKKGKDMIMWASLGLAVIFLSYALVRFVISALTGSGGETQSNPGETQSNS